MHNRKETFRSSYNIVNLLAYVKKYVKYINSSHSHQYLNVENTKLKDIFLK